MTSLPYAVVEHADRPVVTRARLLLTLGVFALLAVLHTWPMMSAPGTWSRNDNADTQLNQWILAWVAQTLPTDPLHLYDANIFHPEPNTLAFSESMIVQGMVAMPFWWLGASTVLMMNAVIVLGMVFSATAMSHLVTRWTGQWLAGLAAGSLVAFNTHLLSRMGHVQAMHVEFLPFVLLALDRVLARATLRDALRLGIVAALQALTSGYLLVMTVVAIVAGTVSRAFDWCRTRPAATLRALAVAALVAAVILAPFLWPYARARAAQGLSRDLEEVAMYEATPTHYLSTAARVHFSTWSHRFYDGRETLFPGFTPLALSVVALFGAGALRDRRARLFAWVAIAGVALSFGPRMPGYAWLHAHVPLFQGVRAVSRFGYLGIFGVAGLSGVGLAWILDRLGRSRRQAAVGLLAIALVNVESMRAPLDLFAFDGIPRVYDVLAAERGAVIAEFPFPTRRYIQHNGPYVLATTRHWQKLLNGYSGYVPPSYDQHARAFAGFPGPSSIAALRAAGVTHVVVHADHDETRIPTADRCPDLRAIAGGRDIRVYRLVPAAQ